MQSSKVVVIGSGVAGMAAARSLVSAGLQVALVEKGERIGGMAAEYACKGTDRCNKCNVCLAHELIRDVKSHPGIQVLTGSRVEIAEPVPGGYRLGVGKSEIECSAVVLATGFEPFDASSKPEFRYGTSPSVITALDLERTLRDGSGVEERVGKPLESVAFIQCVGSRNTKSGRGYCSRVCCMYSLRMAKVLRHRLPAVDTTVFYMDFQGGGKDPGEFRRKAELENSIRFVRAMPGDVTWAPGGRAVVWYEEMESGVCRASEFDLVVLAVGTTPGRDTSALAKMFGMDLDEFGFFKPIHSFGGASTKVPRVFVAGACRGPRDIAESVADGEQAALAVLRVHAAGKAREELSSALPRGTWPGRRVTSKHPETVEVASTVLVLGGGIAGMEAAKALRDLGCRAVIVESKAALGGRSEATSLLAGRMEEDASIDVLTQSRLVALDGQAGNFAATIQGPGALTSKISAGAVIIATGCRREFSESWRRLSGASRVVGLSQLGKSGPPWAGSTSCRGGRVVILVGVRPETAKAVFRQSLCAALSALAAGWEAYVLAPEAAVSTPYDEGLYLEARNAGAVFVKYREEPEVEVGECATLRVLVKDPSLGGLSGGASPETLAIDADALVVAEEAYPQEDTEGLAKILKVNTGPVGFFQDDNVNLLPVLTNRRGVFAVGGCRGTLDVTEAVSDAHIAANLAARLVATGKLEVDWVTAEVDAEKCALCLTCIRTCPHRAVSVDAGARVAKVARTACWGCGVCAAECPGKAITLESYSDEEILSQVTPAVTVFCCEHSALVAAEAALATHQSAISGLNIVTVPCSGKVDIIHLLKAIERGADAVMVAGCFDEGCHYLSGNKRALLRVAQVASALKSAGLEPERVQFYHIGPDMSAAFLKAAQETMEVARELGPVVRRRVG
ncbi:MAG: hydrogenase iron-sulfur subunit [Bacillota bacterium]